MRTVKTILTFPGNSIVKSILTITILIKAIKNNNLYLSDDDIDEMLDNALGSSGEYLKILINCINIVFWGFLIVEILN